VYILAVVVVADIESRTRAFGNFPAVISKFHYLNISPTKATVSIVQSARNRHRQAQIAKVPEIVKSFRYITTMAGPARKKQKREEAKASRDGNEGTLPQKKYYRQRAHANPFSDHALI